MKSVIESYDFIADYTYDHRDQPQHLLIRYKTPSSDETYVSIVDDNTFPRHKVSVTVPPSVNLLSDSVVFGSSNGLICLLGNYRNPGDSEPGSGTPMAVLWNPSIRKSVAIPVDGGFAIGFGVCGATSDPKIVKVCNWNSHRHAEVFTLSSGVWRSSAGNLSDRMFRNTWPQTKVTIDRFIYWFFVGFQFVISFDLLSEEFREIRLPDELAFHHSMQLDLLNRSDSLAVVKWSDMFYEVWVMENGDSNLFTNLLTVNVPDVVSFPMEFSRNGLLMTIVELEDALDEDDNGEEIAGLVVYEFFSKRIIDLGIKGLYYLFSVNTYTESLLLIDQ